MTTASVYPLRLEGELAPKLSRGLWLVKWLLAIPHFIVLFFLWIAFLAVSAIAFFVRASSSAGRSPRGQRASRDQRARSPTGLARRAPA